jgi:Periplasmic binding protein
MQSPRRNRDPRMLLACTTAAIVLLMAACTSGDDDSSSSDNSATSSTEGESLTGPAPGVTDDSVKIGVTYVDTSALAAVNLNYELGDHRAVYQALVDDINNAGGIHGRRLELVLAPIDPTGPASADASCLQLTEDEDVFLVTGFFLADTVTCPLDTHATAVVGGGMTPERLERAKAPWITWLPDTDQPEQTVGKFAEQDELDGNVAVFVSAQDSATMDDVVLPALDELDIEPVETGVMDAPVNDITAVEANVALIAERFQAADADTVLLVGNAAANWPLSMEDHPYRPELLFLDIQAARAFATNEATTDTSILEGSLSAGGYGPDQARFEEPEMQACLDILEAADIETPAPSEVGDDPSNQPYQAAFQACPDIVLTRALLEAAGENLNYETLEAAMDGLEATIPGDPDLRTFGPPPAADGNPTVYLFDWDEAARSFVVNENEGG